MLTPCTTACRAGLNIPAAIPCGVRSVVLDSLSVEVLLVVLIIENLGDNNFRGDVLAVLVLVVRIAVYGVALRKSRRVGETGRIEERMRIINTRVDVSNVDPGAGHSSAARFRPCTGSINNLVALAQIRVVKGVVIGRLHHWRGCNRLERRSVELNRDCVERDIVLARYFRSWRIGSQPSFELVAFGGELGAHRSNCVTIEIDFFTPGWFGSGMNAYRIALELDNRARSVHVWALVEGVSVGVGSDRFRAADAKCYDTQPDRREY